MVPASVWKLYEGEFVVYTYHREICEVDDNIDVFVEVNGMTFSGQVYSVENLRRLLNQPDFSDYFYDPNGIFVDTLSQENIVKAILKMIEEGDLEEIFVKQILG